MDYQEETVTLDLIEEIFPLLEEHEKALNTLDCPLEPDLSAYIKMAALGGLAVYTARKEGILCGYAIYFLRRHPHYLLIVADQDILYLMPEHRRGTTGIKLIKFSEMRLKEDHRVNVISQRSKASSPLDNLFERLGYSEQEKVYIKEL